MKVVANQGGDLVPCTSTPFATQYGEKVGDYFFSPLRKYSFTEQGVKRWYAPLLLGRPDQGRGFAAINLGDVTSTHENIPIPPQRAVLVAHAFETIAARVHVPSPGTYFVVALFSPVGYEGPYEVVVSANGKRLGASTVSDHACGTRHAAFVRLTASGFIDFAINTDKEGQIVACRTFVQYAVVRCDDATGALRLRCDDRASDLAEREIVELHAEAAYQPVELQAPQVGLDERAAVFEREWTLPAEYIRSQYQCSPEELVALVAGNREPAAKKYCIFMIPRSGSTLLTELLSSCGHLGFPSELFVPDTLRTFSLAFSDLFPSYDDFLLSGLRSRNGVFGTEVEADRFAEEPTFFADVHEWQHVYIWREDLLAQAISHQISIETGVWHNFSGSSHEEDLRFISRAAIVDKINFSLRAEQFFRRLFAERGIAPYSISYEQLVSDPVGHARRIAEHLGEDAAGLNFSNEGKVTLRPTAKARNAHYKQLVISGEGELWGYDIHQLDGRYAAVLHGVDLALFDTHAERAPVLFIDGDRDALRERVHQFVVRQISSLPADGRAR